MIGLLDPALFLPRDQIEIQREFDSIVRICKTYSIDLLPIDEYWSDLWSKLAQPLERGLNAQVRRSLQEVRKLGESSRGGLSTIPKVDGKAWRRGFEQLFGAAAIGESWESRMAAATLRAVESNRRVVMLVRRKLNRNLIRHASDNSVLLESSRWVLHVQPKGIGHKQVLCVHDARNIAEPWTARFDWRLPSEAHGAKYPFCPPNHWWKGSTIATRTVSSKPAWCDNRGNGWARPNISGGAGYHWDVFIHGPALQEVVGLSQINVVQFGAPAGEGVAGGIHHVPADKAGKLKDVGWAC